MKMMVVSSDGREHVLVWKLARSPKIQVVYVVSGNGGVAPDRRLQNLPVTGPEVPATFVEREGIHFTTVDPEAPLAISIVDLFRAKGLCIFGLTKAATQLKSSKDFARAFMHHHGIPTAKYQTFSDTVQTHTYADQEGAPIVVKADGLAAGKGVVVVMTAEEAHSAIDMMLTGDRLGDIGTRAVIEEFLAGKEVSFIVVCDGKNIVALATSQDHKRLFNNDVGSNTDDMGAYSPVLVVTLTLHARVSREIIMPIIHGMEKGGIPYTGFLYAGLMIGAEGSPKMLEFNCCMGDLGT